MYAKSREKSQKRKDLKSKGWERGRSRGAERGQRQEKEGCGAPVRKTALPPQMQGAGGDSEGLGIQWERI